MISDRHATEDLLGQASKRAMWRAFCHWHQIADESVPLFSVSQDGTVEVIRLDRSATPCCAARSPWRT